MQAIFLQALPVSVDTIRLAVWLYFRFTSLRDVEEMLTGRGIDATYETVRCWANKFGSAITKRKCSMSSFRSAETRRQR